MMCMLRSSINIYTATMHKKECRSQKGTKILATNATAVSRTLHGQEPIITIVPKYQEQQIGRKESGSSDPRINT